MSVWVLTVWLVYADVNQLWLKQQFDTQEECVHWQAFYSEYPFRPMCVEVKQHQS